MQKILLTTDLSEESKIAFEVAKKLARSLKASVDLLAVIEDPAQAAMMYALDFPVLPDPDIRVQLVEKVQKDLEELQKELFEDLDCKCNVLEAEGPVHSEILRFARENKNDLIIIATRGRTGLKRMVIGSVAEKVVRESEIPVLSVPAKRSA